MISRLPRLVLSSFFVCTLSWLSPQMALGEEAEAAPLPEMPSADLEKNTADTADTAAPKASETFLSNGAALKLDDLGVMITPPAGWEVSTNTGSLSVVMREPRQSAPSYDKAKYQRNITVAAIHRASPIDEKRASELKEEMTKTFTADQSVSNFQVLEHKFFNYRGTNDGLLLYTSLNIGDYPMMQMHVLVSGQEKQFLLTYTDLAERFSDAKDGNFEKAWNSIVSVDVAGPAPSRMEEYYRYGAFAGALAFLGLGAYAFSRRRRRVDYGDEADQMIEASGDSGLSTSSLFATLGGNWCLKSNDDGEAVSGLEFSHAAPLTRQTEYVSNY